MNNKNKGEQKMTRLTTRKRIIKHCIESAPNGAVTVIDLWARYKHFVQQAFGYLDSVNNKSPKEAIIEYKRQLRDLQDAGIINVDNTHPLIDMGNEDIVTLTGI